MEVSNHFTCLTYDTVDFLIQSKYVLFGIYIQSITSEKYITFENEVIPHISIGNYLEENFLCKPVEECNVMIVLKKDDFNKDLQKKIKKFTGIDFPESGNFAVSVNSQVTSRIMDISFLRAVPEGIRFKMKEYGVSAIGFQNDSKENSIQRKEILIAPDTMLKNYIALQSKTYDGGIDE